MSVILCDEFRFAFLRLLEERYGSVDAKMLEMDFSENLSSSLEAYVKLFNDSVLELASSDDRDVPLMKIRTHAMSLSSFFDSIANDVEFLLVGKRHNR